MEITKAQWTTDGDHVSLSMPLSKVDKANRIVSGWASLDNADTQGDVILAEANSRAFARFRGNIREMHQPIAVGKMVSFKEDSFYDSETEKFYNGIFVDVFVSKGAESTWEKVLDGTLQGFSIGGSVLDSESTFVKDAGPDGRTIRFVKDYELVELSLVDSPANQLANVFSITKAADGSPIMKGMVADVKSENVYYCKKDGVAKSSSDESVLCPVCNTGMANIGWYEYGDDSDKTEKFAAVLKKYNSETATEDGGVDVADEKKDATETVEPGSTTTTVAEVTDEGKDAADAANSQSADNDEVAEQKEVEETPEAETTEKAADVSEVAVEEPDFTKMFKELNDAIQSGLVKNREAAEEAISKATQAFEGKVTELVGALDELVNKFESLKNEIANVEKRMGLVEGETAVKKSGDLGGSKGETLEKSGSFWDGRFLMSDLRSK
jgi:hypothetical protein